eukprot:SAG11_NODE_18270_length_495_cov_3.979798_1_plen_21_part_01
MTSTATNTGSLPNADKYHRTR